MGESNDMDIAGLSARDLIFPLAVVLFLVLNLWVFPRLGVRT